MKAKLSVLVESQRFCHYLRVDVQRLAAPSPELSPNVFDNVIGTHLAWF